MTEYLFGEFSIDPGNMLLRKGGEVVKIPPKLFELLLFMVQNAQKTISKDEILTRVWPDSFVEESNIAQCVFHLRKLLGCDSASKRYIETIPKRGYRFVAKLDCILEGPLQADETQFEYQLSSPTSRNARDSSFSQRSRFTFSKVLPRFAFAVLITSLLSLSMVLSYGIFADSSTKRTVVVTRFNGNNLAAEDFYVPLAITESLAAKIGDLENLEVRSAASMADGVGGADAVITGNVSRVDGRLLIAVQLTNDPSGSPVWMRTYEIADAELLNLQQRISEEISGSIVDNVQEKDNRPIARRSTNNYEAFEAYSKGRYFWITSSRTDLAKAISYFEKAIQIDPQYPLAYSGLADAYLIRSVGKPGSYEAEKDLEVARQYAIRAIELSPLLAEPRTTHAATVFAQTGDWENAEREFLTAIEMNPNYSFARHWYALHLLAITGDVARAESEMKKAIELNPVSAVSYLALGQIYYWSGKYEHAVEQFDKAVELDSNFARANVYSALAHKRLGDIDESRMILENTLSAHPEEVGALTSLGTLYAEIGLKEDAEKMIARLAGQPSVSAFNDYGVALIESRLGRTDSASERLKKLSRSRNNISLIARLKFDPDLETLRNLYEDHSGLPK